MLTSLKFGRNIFPMPAFLPLFGRALFVAMLVYIGAWLGAGIFFGNLPTMILGFVTGGMLGSLGALFLNVAGFRTSLWRNLSAKFGLTF